MDWYIGDTDHNGHPEHRADCRWPFVLRVSETTPNATKAFTGYLWDGSVWEWCGVHFAALNGRGRYQAIALAKADCEARLAVKLLDMLSS